MFHYMKKTFSNIFGKISFGHNTNNYPIIIGLFLVNLYTTIQLYYRKSPISSFFKNMYDTITPDSRLEYIPSAKDCKFLMYTFGKIHKKIAKIGLMDLEQISLIPGERYGPLKESPFLSTEIVVTNPTSSSFQSYEVEFRTDTYDYYIDNNVFYPSFIEYFMKKHYGINISDSDYSIHAVDRNTFETLVFLKNEPPIYIWTNTNTVKKQS